MRRVIYILMLGLWATNAYPHDPQFTQFYASPLLLGPSFAGGIPGQRLVTNYRNQWSLVPGTFQTFSVSYDQNFAGFNSGLGLVFLGDVAGDGRMGTTQAGILYSYDFTPSPEFHIRPGIGFYYVQHSIDYSKLIFGDQISSDPMPPSSIQPLGNNIIRDVDVASSILAYSDNLWLGATWNNMLRPKRTFYDSGAKTPYRFSLYGGGRLLMRGKTRTTYEESVTAAFNLKMQDVSKQLDLGLYWYREPLMFGAWYRGIPLVKEYPGRDAVAFLLGYNHNNLSVAYSYDFTVSRLGVGSGGSHEIALIYKFKIEIPKRYRAIPCPTF